jgi:hypothetical protein
MLMDITSYKMNRYYKERLISLMLSRRVTTDITFHKLTNTQIMSLILQFLGYLRLILLCVVHFQKNLQPFKQEMKLV